MILKSLVSSALFFLAGTLSVATAAGTSLAPRTPAQVAGPVAGSQFGAILARHENTLVVGAPDEKIGSLEKAGAVYIYERGTAGEWVQKIRLQMPTPLQNAHFGSAVSVHHNTLIIGAAGTGNVILEGRVFHCTRLSGEWQAPQVFPTQDFPNKTSLGGAVAVHGNFAAVAAPTANIESVSQAGFVKVYSRESEGGAWTSIMDLKGIEGASLCGTSLAIENSHLLVGFPGEPNGKVLFAGKVAAYKLRQDGASFLDELRPPAPKLRGLFGFSLAIQNGRVLVGTAEAGRAYAFRLDALATAWEPIGTLSPSPAPAGVAFSFVDLQGETAAVLTAHNLVNDLPTDGAVHLFSSVGPAWKQQTRIKHGAGMPAGSWPTAISLRSSELVVGTQFQDSAKGAIHDFNVVRSGPEIEVSYEQRPLVTGVGQVTLGSDIYTYVMSGIEITNRGDAPLTFPSQPRGKNLSKGMRYLSFTELTTLQPGQTEVLGINFDPAVAGPYGVTVEIPSNDPDEKVFSVRVTGVALPPDPPVFELQPGDFVTTYGNGGTLSARAVTEHTMVQLRYVWKKDGKVIPGVTGETCPVNTTDMAKPGRYTCEVSDGFTTIVSEPADVTLIRETEFYLRVPEGGTATLTSSVAGPFVRYNWTKGTESTPVGTDSPTLVLNNVTLADSDTYHGYISTEIDGDWSFTYGTLVVYNAAPTLTQVESLPPAQLGRAYFHQLQGLLTGVNAADEVKITGLPKGLNVRFAGSDGWVISGVPVGAANKTYPLSITALNKLGTASIKTSLQVNPLETGIAGTYNATIPSSQALPQGGRLEFNVTSTGAYTGKFYLGSRVEAVKGVMVRGLHGSAYRPTSDSGGTRIEPKSGDVVWATYDAELQGGIGQTSTFRLAIGGVDPDSTQLPRPILTSDHQGALWKASSSGGNYRGVYNLAFKPPADGDSAFIPQGYGFASLTVAANGIAKLVGKTADGESITTSVALGTEGDFPLHQALYRTSQKGALNGQFRVDSSRNISGLASWMRPKDKSKSARLYKDGFLSGYLFTIVGGAYTPPTTFLNPSTEDLQAGLSFASAGISLPPAGPGIDVTLLAGGKVQLPAAAQNPRKTSLSTVLKTGAFSGAFTLSDPNPASPTGKPLVRTVKYQGLAVPENGSLRGYGYFLLPQLPTAEPLTTLSTSPIRSGEVRLVAD